MPDVMTCGCFDILTQAHCKLIESAGRLKAAGGTLIVALNTDESIRKLKGPSRPIVPYRQREAVLKTLRYVDRVIPLEDTDPTYLIRKLQPEFFVKSGGYTRETMPEWDAVEAGGGTVVLLGDFGGLSTSQIVEKCRCLTYA